MSAFAATADLRIGRIVEVSGSAIRIELDGNISELTRTFRGRVYLIGQFGSIVKIHFGRIILFAYVRLLRMRSEVEREQGRPPVPLAEDSRIIDADLFAEGVLLASSTLELRRGVRHYPLPGQPVYLTTQDEVKHLYQGAEVTRTAEGGAMCPIGTYVASEGTECYANLNKLFGMHCAVLGSTGSGKSGTVAAILHAILDHRPKPDAETLRPQIVVVDPHGEYTTAFGDRAVVYRAYKEVAVVGSSGSVELRLPYWLLTSEEFRELVVGKTEYEATSENNIVFKAVGHARLVQRGWIEKSRKWEGAADGNVVAADHRLTAEKWQPRIAEYDSDTPDPFSLDEFENHIRWEQGVREKAKKWESMSPSEFKSHASVLDKLKVLRSDPRLKFMLSGHQPGDADLPAILAQFVGSVEGKPRADIRIVDISGLPNEVAGPLTAAIARLLFQYKIWQTHDERQRNPVLLVCEEAHRYVPDTGLAEYQSAQRAIRRIAKEGRKYGLGMMLVSQRPADVERTVLSQCNSWIVMRLTNATDQEYVSRFLPDNLAGLSRLLPSLSRQEAIFVGEAAAVPARVMIRTLDEAQLPRSNDVPFVDGWAKGPVDQAAIECVVKRWRRE